MKKKKKVVITIAVAGWVAVGGVTGALTVAGHGEHGHVTTLTAEQIATRLNLGKVSASAYDAKTDPNGLLGRQGQYTSKVNWGSIGTTDDAEQRSSIEVFPNAGDAQARLDYVKGFSGTFVGDGYDYLTGSALLRLSRSYTPDEAKDIENSFRNATGG
jgi:hypothetical protein